jgi:hypothetical protein
MPVPRRHTRQACLGLMLLFCSVASTCDRIFRIQFSLSTIATYTKNDVMSFMLQESARMMRDHRQHAKQAFACGTGGGLEYIQGFLLIPSASASSLPKTSNTFTFLYAHLTLTLLSPSSTTAIRTVLTYPSHIRLENDTPHLVV